MTTKLTFTVLLALTTGSNSRRVLKVDSHHLSSDTTSSQAEELERFFKNDFKSMAPNEDHGEMKQQMGLTSNSQPSEQEVRVSGSHKSNCAKPGEDFKDFDGCKQVQASGMTFDCRFGNVNDNSKGNVMLLHGFPEWSSMWVPAMKALAEEGYTSVACNQRGYSPGASPDDELDYNYNKLRDDIFNVATAVGFEKFHLVAHDHGAVLGWWSAGSARGRERIVSYTGISIPHTDAFSAGLFGPTADVDQQVASQYFSMFTLPDSASIRGYAWTNFLGMSCGFFWAEDFQKPLWWYNGAMAAGALAGPPVMSASTLWSGGNKAMATLRWIFGDGPEDQLEGMAASSPTGPISMPAQYICGSQDGAILCNKPFAMETKNYCKGGYRYVEVDGGHDPMTENNQATVDTVNAIVEWVVQTESGKNAAEQ